MFLFIFDLFWALVTQKLTTKIVTNTWIILDVVSIVTIWVMCYRVNLFPHWAYVVPTGLTLRLTLTSLSVLRTVVDYLRNSDLYFPSTEKKVAVECSGS
jgi:CHASE2 domain-containing sensor protein